MSTYKNSARQIGRKDCPLILQQGDCLVFPLFHRQRGKARRTPLASSGGGSGSFSEWKRRPSRSLSLHCTFGGRQFPLASALGWECIQARLVRSNKRRRPHTHTHTRLRTYQYDGGVALHSIANGEVCSTCVRSGPTLLCGNEFQHLEGAEESAL